MHQRLIDWLFTIPFLALFGGTLLAFDPLQRIARLFGQRPQEIVAGALQIVLVWVFRIAGTRLEVERSPGVLPSSPYLFISNHQSLFDIPILGALLFSNFPKYVSKQELAKWIPSISYNLRRGGNAIIDRTDRGQATSAIRKLAQQVTERGVSAVLYPEGTRARRGELRRFRNAGAIALLEAAPGVPVVPITIDGSWELLRFNLMPVPFGTRVRVRIGTPIERKPDEDPVAVLEGVRNDIATTLDGWRAGSSEG
ncbi:MAG: lysophospholipid acyltransferase family protein [Myxococcota bacterium]|nr:lysophospholipid acyltransferase family protein [Myxococcota bacterium]